MSGFDWCLLVCLLLILFVVLHRGVTEALDEIIEIQEKLESNANQFVTTVFMYHCHIQFSCGSKAKGVVSVSDPLVPDNFLYFPDSDKSPPLFAMILCVNFCVNGSSEVLVGVDDPIDAFRDRLLGEGWTISGPTQVEGNGDVSQSCGQDHCDCSRKESACGGISGD